jgi:hypothetical protein
VKKTAMFFALYVFQLGNYFGAGNILHREKRLVFIGAYREFPGALCWNSSLDIGCV